MIWVIVMQASRSTQWESLHKHFSARGSESSNWISVVLVLVALLGLLIGARALQRYQSRSTAPQQQHHPWRLFKELLRQLPLSARQQALLKRIARDLDLATPAHLLLSPGLFSASAERWLRLTRTPLDRHLEEFATITAVLFPRPHTD